MCADALHPSPARLSIGVGVMVVVFLLSAANAAAVAFPIAHSANGRYLVDREEEPFPILGRTAWFVLSLESSQIEHFVADTQARGFNTIELYAMTHDVRGNNAPRNGAGELPFLKQLDGASWNGSLDYREIAEQAPDFTSPNEAYWQAVDSLLAICEKRGILVLLFPSYVGFAGGAEGWMQEMVANGPSRMRAYGRWIASRYRSQPNIVWMAGGDLGTPPRDFTDEQTEVHAAMLAGMKSITEQQSVHFSAEWTSQSIATDQADFGSAMTLNGVYSWSGRIASLARRAYEQTPTRPVFLLEGPYDEEGPDGNNTNPSAAQPVRRFQWWGWLSSIGGYVTGNAYVWLFRSPWTAHLDTRGARDMAVLNEFVGSIAWYELVPSGLDGMRRLVTSEGSEPDAANFVSAAATRDGTLLVAYVPPGHRGTFVVDLGAMAAPLRVRWLDPTTGAYTADDTKASDSSVRRFATPGPNARGDMDWALVVDTAGAPASRSLD